MDGNPRGEHFGFRKHRCQKGYSQMPSDFLQISVLPFRFDLFKEPAEVKIYFWVKNHPVSRLEIEAYANFQDQIERRHYD